MLSNLCSQLPGYKWNKKVKSDDWNGIRQNKDTWGGGTWKRRYIILLMKQNTRSCNIFQNFLFSKYKAVSPIVERFFQSILKFPLLPSGL